MSQAKTFHLFSIEQLRLDHKTKALEQRAYQLAANGCAYRT